jgi:tetratricopeptide (TPR) repeat protein
MVKDERSERILEKLDRLQRTGNRATAKFVAEEAVAYFARRKENLEREPPSKERDLALAELEKYLGDVHKVMGEHDDALGHYHKVMDLSKGCEKDPEAAKFIADAYNAKGDIYLRRGDWEKAMENFRKALELAKIMQYDSGEAEAARLIGYVNWRLGSFSKADDFFKKALAIAEEINDMDVQGKTYIDLGNLENESGNLDKAQTYYNKALKLLEKVDDKYELARVYNNMGDICIKRQDWTSGIKYFERCNDIAIEIRDPRWKGWAMFNMAECLSKSGNPKRAIDACERAERALSHTDDKIAMAHVHINYGIAYRLMKEWDLSEERFRKGLEQLENLKSPQVLAWAYTEFGRMLREKGSDELAAEYLRKAISMYRKLGAMKSVQALTKELAAMSCH